MKQAIQKMANSLCYRISKIREPIEYPFIDVLDLILQSYLRQNQDTFFIQIGANDGASYDPVFSLIRKYHLRGLLVEPQPQMFHKLVQNYQNEDQLLFENSAIFTEDGQATFYIIREEEPKLPIWCYQIANLNRNRMLEMLADQKQKLNLPGNVETLIEAISVPAITFETLLAKYSISKLDLLIIDTIGYDFEIIKMIPFHLVKPSIIHFEHALLSLEEQTACFRYLAEFGYSLIPVAVDTIAYLDAPSRLGLYSF